MLIEAIGKHRAWLESSGQLAERMRTIVSTEITMRVQDALLRQIRRPDAGNHALGDLIDRVVAREVAPHRAAEELFGRLTGDSDV